MSLTADDFNEFSVIKEVLSVGKHIKLCGLRQFCSLLWMRDNDLCQSFLF